MSTISSTPVPRSHVANGPLVMAKAAVKRWCGSYIAWRVEQAAIAQLRSMSDRELHDIGLARSQIEAAVRGGADRKRDRMMIAHF